ncbi:glycosyltransferase family 2 protein [Halarcobacter sp.]|uniref:glycosyltransferase family 2 protein n=1 Tax=Halarcobacter sp. TaxID=2321133 RepID=UPI002AA9219E|nr:glycosyltransferase family 2 protein [Halarcobacter sp.]
MSVIIPIYNVEKYLKKCLDSVIKQSFKEIEILIINDGSPDNSLSIARNYKEKDSRIKIINQENKGLGGARNTGIKYSKTRYLIFIDSDDTIHPKMVELLYNEAFYKKCDIVTCRYKRVNSSEEVLSISPKEYSVNNPISDFMTSNISLMVCNKIYKKNLFIENKIFFPEKRFYEDQFVTLQLFFYSKKNLSIENILYNWFVRENSITQSISNKHIEDMFFSLSSIKNFLIDNSLFNRYEGFFYSRSLYIITTHLLSSLCIFNIDTKIYLQLILYKLSKLTTPQKDIIEIVKKENPVYFINFSYNFLKVILINKLDIGMIKFLDSKSLTNLEYKIKNININEIDSEMFISILEYRNIKEVILYGAGKLASDLLKKLEKNRVKVLAVIDRNDSNFLNEFKVSKLEDITLDLNNKNILITSIAYAIEIQNLIENYAKKKNFNINILSICNLF